MFLFLTRRREYESETKLVTTKRTQAKGTKSKLQLVRTKRNLETGKVRRGRLVVGTASCFVGVDQGLVLSIADNGENLESHLLTVFQGVEERGSFLDQACLRLFISTSAVAAMRSALDIDVSVDVAMDGAFYAVRGDITR
jgi:hypothetical protein